MKPRMAISFIDSLILHSSRLEKCAAFYRELGLSLEHEQHGDGPVHYAGELQGAHIAIYEAKPGTAGARGIGGATQIGFRVSSLEETFRLVVEAGAKVLVEPQTVPWGKRVVVEDPDGRPVELNQG
jgi:lactoylglutathione lyase